MGENTEVLYSKSSTDISHNNNNRTSLINRQRPQSLPSGGRQPTDVTIKKNDFPFKIRLRRGIVISNPHEVVVEAHISDTTNQHEHDKSVLTVNYNMTKYGSRDKNNTDTINNGTTRNVKLNSSNPPRRRHPLLFLMPPEEYYLKKPNFTPDKNRTEKSVDDVPVSRSSGNRFVNDDESLELSPMREKTEYEKTIQRIIRQSNGDEVKKETEMNEKERPDLNKLDNDLKTIMAERLPSSRERINNVTSHMHDIKSHESLKLTNLNINITNENVGVGKNQSNVEKNNFYKDENGLNYQRNNLLRVSGSTTNGKSVDKKNLLSFGNFSRSHHPEDDENDDSIIFSNGSLNKYNSTESYSFLRTTTSPTTSSTQGMTTRIGYFIGGQCECSCPCLDAGWNDDVVTSIGTTNEYRNMKVYDSTTDTNKMENLTTTVDEYSTETVVNNATTEATTTTTTEDVISSTMTDFTNVFYENNNNNTTVESATDEIYDESSTQSSSESSTITDYNYNVEVTTGNNIENSSDSNVGCPVVTPPPPMILVLEGEDVVF